MSRLPQEFSLHTEASGPAPPDAFGPFRVLHQIGAGALGPVFRAYEPDRDRLAAIKLFRLDLPPERAHQLVNEFEQLIEVNLQHPVIAAPLTTGLSGVVAYLATDYFSGDSLDIVTRQNGTPPAIEALRIARQLAEALDFAADRQVEHGALSPRDVLLSQDEIRIVGIGVTRALERVGAAAPLRRPYTAPERVEGGAWDRRADVFSLAAIVHELLLGRRLAGTGLDAVMSMTEVEGFELGALQRAFASALAEDPADRFATATEFAEALEGAVSRAPLRVVVPRESRAPSPEPRVDLLLPLDEAPAVMDEASAVIQGEEPAVIEDEEPAVIKDPPTAIEYAPPDVSVAGEDLEIKAAEPERPDFDIKIVPLFVSANPPAPEPEPVRSEVFPSFLSAPPVATPSSSSLVWPIGLAWVVGVAIGFGGGYTVAIRDRTTAAPPAAATSNKVEADVRLPPEAAAATASTSKSASAATEPAPPVAVGDRPSAPAATKPIAASATGTGRIVVRSTPAGARVFVDGRDRGQTPATIRDLSRGEHRIRVVRDGYTAAERRLVLSAARPSQLLTVPLAKAPGGPRGAVAPQPAPERTTAAGAATGTLVIESRPQGARVFVDTRPVGITPVTLAELKAGEHAVRLERDGYQRWTSPVNVVGGTTNRVRASLEQ